MDPTSLPTDSLYKFWALGSMLALGSVLYFARKRSQELHARKDALELEIRKNKLRLAHVTDLKDAINAIERKRQEELAAAEAAHRIGALNEQIDASVSSSNWALLGILLSFASLVLGFYFWYQKAQRYQDEATMYAVREQKARTELAELDLMEKRKASKRAGPSASATTPSP